MAYYRVSTRRQGESGLGLEAQRAAVAGFVKGPILAEFTEVESGKKNDRPQLSAAIDACKKESAVLIIAKLDRLSRNAAFIFLLRDSGVDFTCVDMPDANTLTVGIMAVLAQHERELISSRTKAALQVKRSQGLTLGSPQNLTQKAQHKGAESNRRKARENIDNRRASKLATMLRKANYTLSQIAEQLNESGFRTPKGHEFHAAQVQRLLVRQME